MKSDDRKMNDQEALLLIVFAFGELLMETAKHKNDLCTSVGYVIDVDNANTNKHEAYEINFTCDNNEVSIIPLDIEKAPQNKILYHYEEIEDAIVQATLHDNDYIKDDFYINGDKSNECN